jgi:hypothetical protein
MLATVCSADVCGIEAQRVEAELSAGHGDALIVIAGLLAPGQALVAQRPFRAPHHAAGGAGLSGGRTSRGFGTTHRRSRFGAMVAGVCWGGGGARGTAAGALD